MNKKITYVTDEGVKEFIKQLAETWYNARNEAETKAQFEKELEAYIKTRETKAEARGREYRLDRELAKYLNGEQVDAMAMVQGFANVFIQVMCIDTNADKATMKLEGMRILGRNVGDWKVVASKVKEKKNAK